MQTYITGPVIKRLREAKRMTQAELAQKIGVSDKAVSKWETAKGLPDITLIEPLAGALGVSVMELLSGEPVVNRNLSANIRRLKFYVCPVCGNLLQSTGDAVICCCGIPLPPLEPEPVDAAHEVTIERVEDEHFITVHHDMTKQHYISFLAYVIVDRVQLVKFYPEQNPETRIPLFRSGDLYLYCNRHGLMKMRV